MRHSGAGGAGVSTSTLGNLQPASRYNPSPPQPQVCPQAPAVGNSYSIIERQARKEKEFSVVVTTSPGNHYFIAFTIAASASGAMIL